MQMKNASKDLAAARFSKLDFHDDALISLRIWPPNSRRNSTRIEFEFRDDSTEGIKKLSFKSCANFRFNMDFDVLADNWHFGNTEAFVAKSDHEVIRKFVTAHRSHWSTKYMPPMSREKPIKEKLQSIRNYIWFRLAFFGGTAEILAKGYQVSG